MQKQRRLGWQSAALAVALMSTQSYAGQVPVAPQDIAEELKQVKGQLAEQGRQLDALRRALSAQSPAAQQAPTLAPALAPAPAPEHARLEQAYGDGGLATATATQDQLAAARGTGNQQQGTVRNDDRADANGAGSNQAREDDVADQQENASGAGDRHANAASSKVQDGLTDGAPVPANSGAATSGVVAAGQRARPMRKAGARGGAGVAAVGKPPESARRPPEVAPLFEQPGVLTPRGRFIFEPGLQFGYSSSNRVALVGYTVIPALLIGLIDVREMKRNTFTASVAARTGLTNRLEVEARVPYVYRSDATVSREIFTGTAVERVFDTSGRGVGDAELAARYQLNNGGPDKAYYIGSLRYKSRTGTDPFEVVTDCSPRCIGTIVTGTGLPLELPTGSGFHSLQPSLTWLFPSDPAVFFGSLSYLHNFRRSNVSRTVLGGEQEFLGDVKPGDIIGFNFGMGLALNDKASFSLGYDHSSVGRTKQGGIPVTGSVRTQLGTLLLGYSYRLSDKRTINVSLGAGLTRDTPDVSLSIRVPTSF